MSPDALFSSLPDDLLLDLAERQHGLVTHSQVLDLGIAPRGWERLYSSAAWDRITPRVVRRRGSPPTDRQRALAACLDLGDDAYLSHASAASLWGLPGCSLHPLEVMVVRSRRTSSGLARVHHPRLLPDPHAARIDGIPVVRPALVLLQLAPRMHPEQLRRRLDWLWSRRLLSAPSMRRELEPIMRRGRPGTAVLRELLDGLPADYVPPASGLESRFQQIVADHDLPPMHRQADLGDDEQWCGRVDFLAVEVPLVVEVQSDLFHTALSSQEDDARRRSRLVGAGFTVVEVDESMVWHRPAEVARLVRDGYWAALRRRSAA